VTESRAAQQLLVAGWPQIPRKDFLLGHLDASFIIRHKAWVLDLKRLLQNVLDSNSY
jgi:hypothetical protein